jgi:hypothetical protein
MVIYLVASEAASRFERWGDVSLCMRRASTVALLRFCRPPFPNIVMRLLQPVLTQTNHPDACAQVCLALSEVWVGLDLLAESHAIQQKAKLPSPPPIVGSGGETAEDPSGVLQDLLYASISLGALTSHS